MAGGHDSPVPSMAFQKRICGDVVLVHIAAENSRGLRDADRAVQTPPQHRDNPSEDGKDPGLASPALPALDQGLDDLEGVTAAQEPEKALQISFFRILMIFPE